MSTIVLFRSALEPLNLFSNQLAKGFEKLGYDIYFYELGNGYQSLSQLYEYIQSHTVVSMIGFNCKFFGLITPSGINVWETLGIKCINILLDHPYWYHEILQAMPSTGVVLCVDRNHLKYLNDYYSNISITGFLPHGGTKSSGSIIPISERKYDVLYVGSVWSEYKNYHKPSFDMFDFDGEYIYDQALEYLEKNTDKTVEEALSIYWEEYQSKNGTLNYSLNQFISYCRNLESVMGTRYRLGTIKAIADTGVNVTIFGTGWENSNLLEYPNVFYKGVISASQVLEEIANCKILINTMPWFKDGSHERIYNALLNGALPVTEENAFWNETLNDDCYLKFKLNEESIKKMAEEVKILLEKSDIIKQKINSVSQDFLTENTWEYRAKEIHEAILMR